MAGWKLLKRSTWVGWFDVGRVSELCRQLFVWFGFGSGLLFSLVFCLLVCLSVCVLDVPSKLC